MREDLKKRLEAISPDERRERFELLRETPGIGEPVSTASGRVPAEVDQEDLEEYQFLQKLLGYR